MAKNQILNSVRSDAKVMERFVQAWQHAKDFADFFKRFGIADTDESRAQVSGTAAWVRNMLKAKGSAATLRTMPRGRASAAQYDVSSIEAMLSPNGTQASGKPTQASGKPTQASGARK